MYAKLLLGVFNRKLLVLYWIEQVTFFGDSLTKSLVRASGYHDSLACMRSVDA